MYTYKKSGAGKTGSTSFCAQSVQADQTRSSTEAPHQKTAAGSRMATRSDRRRRCKNREKQKNKRLPPIYPHYRTYVLFCQPFFLQLVENLFFTLDVLAIASMPEIIL